MTGRGTDRQNPLGEYLRARRELVTPQAVGLPEDSRRRVPGLRREEVALLAGISSDYYLRLEQGRNRNPSAQVLGSIARALRLDGPSTQYLLGLGTAPRPSRGEPRRGRPSLPGSSTFSARSTHRRSSPGGTRTCSRATLWHARSPRS
ncbi:helix-turn-helix domain-containing protein [Nocardiopsis dassonvillei]|uniref:helix-turn-helix domain-containing protein n=1 Tax=Nocardiopsis dassonvillei TaxID=2014 RepID=UPI0033CF4BD2